MIKLKMEVSSRENEFHSDFVLMPWDDKTKIYTKGDNNVTKVCSRWELIQKQLNASAIISNVDQLINVIKSYNIVNEKDGQQTKPFWKCLVLRQYFSQLDEFERNQFFLENGILSTIRNLALQLKELLPRLKILKTGSVSTVRLHQLQIASVLANAFLCTFPKGEADCPSINFTALYEAGSNSVLKYNVEKIKCIIHYFKRIHNKQPTGNLSFHRLSIPDHKFPRWDKTTADLCSLKVGLHGKIEDQEGYLQMDFANKYIGGGVLGRGCVQEEIRFVICPELIAARLFTECLADNESLFIIGAERYCQYSGYSNTFTFTGDYKDTTPYDENRHKKTYLIVLDALYFHRSSEQYRESKLLRELKKAYVGFKPVEGNCVLPLATGNWGCGAFGGDPQLKSILQLMASSQAQRDMLYLTFGNSVLKNQIEELYHLLKRRAVNVGMLYRIIRLYNRERRKNETVFEFIIASLNRPEKRKLSPKPITPSGSSQALSSSSFDSDLLSLMEKGTKTKCEVENRKSRDTLEENFPQLDIDFNALDKLVQSNFVNDGPSFNERKPIKKYSCYESNERRPDFSSESHSILDEMWLKNEKNSSASASEGGMRQQPLSETASKNDKSSQSLFTDEEEMEITSEIEKILPKEEDMDVFEPETTNHSENTKAEVKNFVVNERKIQSKKMVQSKITDCFIKK